MLSFRGQHEAKVLESETSAASRGHAGITEWTANARTRTVTAPNTQPTFQTRQRARHVMAPQAQSHVAERLQRAVDTKNILLLKKEPTSSQTPCNAFGNKKDTLTEHRVGRPRKPRSARLGKHSVASPFFAGSHGPARWLEDEPLERYTRPFMRTAVNLRHQQMSNYCNLAGKPNVCNVEVVEGSDRSWLCPPAVLLPRLACSPHSPSQQLVHTGSRAPKCTQHWLYLHILCMQWLQKPNS